MNKKNKKLKEVFLIIGSNKGHRNSNIKRALNLIDNHEQMEVRDISYLYITQPWGYRRQNNFYNRAFKIHTTLEPRELLVELQKIEKIIGKKKTHYLAPRIIDIDIALYEDVIINEDDLVIPHKYLTIRDFFIVPIVEMDKNIKEPVNNKKLSSYLKNVEREYIIKIIYN